MLNYQQQGKSNMAIDFDALKKKLGQLSGQNRKSNITWRPEEGKDYNIRIIAMPNNDGQPFLDRWYYYGLGGDKAGAIRSPHQVGKKDPIQDLINKLKPVRDRLVAGAKKIVDAKKPALSF